MVDLDRFTGTWIPALAERILSSVLDLGIYHYGQTTLVITVRVIDIMGLLTIYAIERIYTLTRQHHK